MADFPSTSSAYGVWTLRDQREAKLGGNWPIPITPPGAPTSVSATGGSAQATVSFTAPADTGTGGAITGYRVTASPGGATATGSSSPITITGLTNGTAYTFTVAAQNSAGYGAESSASNSVTPTAVNKTTAVDYLVVAGGAGGGTGRGAGGGAGGYRASNIAVTSGSPITVTVGAGGAGGYGGWGTTATNRGFNGNNSTFSSITSTGGGGGAVGWSGDSNYIGLNGGSGGGGGDGGAAGTGVSGQGNAGGIGGNHSGGGGGGAGNAGGAAGSNLGGNGGDGANSLITGSSVLYAGGGGGSSTTPGTGGNGGGGNGGGAANGQAGSTNTGGGGGGAGTTNDGSTRSGGAGGSGVVIIRYPNTYDDAVSVTGTYTFTNTGGYKIYKWTGSGSITF